MEIDLPRLEDSGYEVEADNATITTVGSGYNKALNIKLDGLTTDSINSILNSQKPEWKKEFLKNILLGMYMEDMMKEVIEVYGKIEVIEYINLTL